MGRWGSSLPSTFWDWAYCTRYLLYDLASLVFEFTRAVLVQRPFFLFEPLTNSKEVDGSNVVNHYILAAFDVMVLGCGC